MSHEESDCRPGEFVLGLLLFGGRYPGMPPGRGITDALALAGVAERAGWREAWVAEHHFNPNLDASSAMTLAGYLLGATESMRVGTAAAVLSVWHPLAVAEQANLLSHASGGRFSLGVARGMPTIDWNILGDGAGRAEPSVFGETLDILLSALRGDRVESDTEVFRFPSVATTPGPRPEGVPVFVAANNEPTIRVAAARRLPLLLPPFVPTPVKRTILDTYRDEAERQGFDPSSVPHYNGAIVHVATDRARAQRDLEQTWAEWFAQVTRDTPALVPIPKFGAADLAGMLTFQPLGSPEQVADHLRAELETLGLHRNLLIIDGTGRGSQAQDNAAAVAEALGIRRRSHR